MLINYKNLNDAYLITLYQAHKETKCLIFLIFLKVNSYKINISYNELMFNQMWTKVIIIAILIVIKDAHRKNIIN